MKTEEQAIWHSGQGLIAVCILAIIVSASSIITTSGCRKWHPSSMNIRILSQMNQGATRSRLLDMRFFIMSMFTRPDWSEQDLQQLLNERYEIRYHSIGIISRQYLGPKRDADQAPEGNGGAGKRRMRRCPLW